MKKSGRISSRTVFPYSAGAILLVLVAAGGAATGAEPNSSPDDVYWSDQFTLPGTDGYVRAATRDASGHIYIGGDFTVVGNVAANYIAKWNTATSTWSALGTGMTGSVTALAVDGSGNIYAGGGFTTAGGVAANFIAKWDGTAWSALGTGMDDWVYALAVDGSDNVYAGGWFATAGGVAASYIAKWDGTEWSALGTGVDGGNVFALAVDGLGNVYAGGGFTMAGGVTANFIAKWNGAEWSALGRGMGGTVDNLVVDGLGNVYAGGGFSNAGGVEANYVAQWDGTSWSALGTGANNTIDALAIDGLGNVYAGGWFTTAGGVEVNYIAKWDRNTWSALSTGTNGAVWALAVDGLGNVYAGGVFTTAGSLSVDNIGKWDGTAWSALGTGMGMNYTVNTIAADGSGNVYAGGEFTAAGGVEASRIAKWDGAAWSILGSGVDAEVRALAVDGAGNVYAGGYFTTAGGLDASYIAKWNGKAWSALGTGMNMYVYALAADGLGNVYAGGEFTAAGGVSANSVAKWSGTGWSALGTGISGTVYGLALDGSGSLYAGGTFNMAGGVSAQRIAKWDGTAWSALGTGMDGEVYALAVDGSDNLYAGGWFMIAGGVQAKGIAKWDGTAWSALAPQNLTGNSVNTVAVDMLGNVYAAGYFNSTAADGAEANNIAKWNGTVWSALGTGVSGTAVALALDQNRLFAGGYFTQAGGKVSAYFALWQPEGVMPPNPPIVSGITPTANTTPTWTWTSGGGGNGIYRYQLDATGGPWTATTDPAFTPAISLPDGPHTLYVQEENSIGDWSLSGFFTIVIDTTPPNPPIVTGITPTNDTTPTWTWTPGGGDGMGVYEYQLDGVGGAWTDATATTYTPLSPLPGGTHRLYVRERDVVGNWSVESFFDIVIDATPPNPPIVTGVTPTNDKTPTWTWTPGGGDGVGVYEYQLDGVGGAWTDATATTYTPLSPLPDGAHRLYVRERDVVGNWSVEGFFDIVIDATPPNPPIVTGVTPTNDTTPTWTWTPGGGDGVGVYTYQLDGVGGAWTDATATSYTPLSPLPGGTHRLYVRERDVVGNWSVDGFFDIVIDATPPNPPIVTGVTPTNDTTPTWTWTPGGGDGAGVYTYQLDGTGGPWTDATATSYTPLSPLTGGTHRLYVRERDAVGNWSVESFFDIVIDTMPPNPPIVSGVTPTNDTTPTWTWISGGGGNGTYRYQLDGTGGPWTDATATSYTPLSPLPGGTHRLYVRERDAVGNWSVESFFDIVIDTMPPNPPIVTGVTPTNDTTPTWTWISGGGGNGTYRYQLDGTGGTWTETTATTYTPLSPLPDGAHRLYVCECDALGNWSASGSFVVVIDTVSGSDTDGDGLTATVEAAIETNPDDPDTDGDGLDDGYEHTHGLDPLDPEDAYGDMDGDGYTNFEEYLLRSDPLDPNSPRDTFYVSAGLCADTPTSGAESDPWCSITYALDHIEPTEQVPVTIVLLPGAYTEDVVLKPYVMLAGTESGEKPLIQGAVTAAASTELRRLALMPPEGADSGILLDITSDNVVVKEVDFSGAGFTGIRFDSPSGAGVVFDQCLFSTLVVGIEILDALPTVRRCIFDEIFADAIIVRASMSGEKAEDDGSLGEEGDANSGYNTFLATGSYAVFNEREDEPLVMENNDWDTDDAGEIAGRIGGLGAAEVDFDPPLLKGAGVMAASVFCSVWNAENKIPIENASIQLDPGAFSPVTENTAGMYTFACVPPGDWTFDVTAPNYADASQSATVQAGETKSLLFPMQASEDDDNPPPGCFGG
ncbi:MAG TPA: carboxypeptidase regulatory-like domain-containing protein [Candidatus Bathyarchaeia archaeon]|nr:carboxypeptidase regulatory-like domain-containing protein [Candidatus Bathyarchaeia archaeon]